MFWFSETPAELESLRQDVRSEYLTFGNSRQRLMAHIGCPVPLLEFRAQEGTYHAEVMAWFAQQFDAMVEGRSPERWGAYLGGTAGTGKSALACQALASALKRGMTARFVTFDEFIALGKENLQASKDGEGPASDRRIAVYYEALMLFRGYEVLVLDDYGRMDVAEFFRQEIPSMLRERHRHGLFTIVTANMGKDQFTDHRMVDFIWREYKIFGFKIANRFWGQG